MRAYKSTLINNASVAAGFVLLSILFSSQLFYHISLFTIAIGLLNQRLANFFEAKWKLVATTIGKINAVILLSVFYLIAILPLTFFRNITHRGRIKHSTWQHIEPSSTIDFTKPY
jgi:hypothetical protein